MTSRKAHKSAVRARMERTGERYTVAARALGGTPPVRRTSTTTVHRTSTTYRAAVNPQAHWQIGGVAGDPLCLTAQDLLWPAGVDDREWATVLQLAQDKLGSYGWDVLTPAADNPLTDQNVVELVLIRNDLGLRLDRLPAAPDSLYTEPAAVARQAQLRRLPKATLAAMVRAGVRGPDGTVQRVAYGEPERWRKDELAIHIVNIERPDLPWGMTPYNHGRRDRARGAVDPTQLTNPDYKLGVMHQTTADLHADIAADHPGRVVLADGHRWLDYHTALTHWRDWLAAGEDDEQYPDRALTVLLDTQAALFAQHLPPDCRWWYPYGVIVGPVGTVLPAGLEQVMHTIVLGVEKMGDELLADAGLDDSEQSDLETQEPGRQR